MVRTLRISRAACCSKRSSSPRLVSSGMKQPAALIIAERMAIGCAAGGKPSKWCFMPSWINWLRGEQVGEPLQLGLASAARRR